MSTTHSPIPVAARARRGLVIAAAALAGALMATAGMAAEPEKGDKKAADSQAEREQKLESARQRLDAAAREVAELSMSMSEDMMPMRQFAMGRAAQRSILGINIGSADKSDSAEGVQVASVSPGGAAADAGLKSGDVLLEANGKALKRDGDATPRDKLLGVMREVKPGEKVAVSYRRDGKVAKTVLVAQPLANHFFTMAVPGTPMPAAGVATMSPFAHVPDFAFMRADGVFGSAELVPLTPKLGQYFGTEKGLLVVRAPADTRLKLEDGDVIMDIDGRTPSSPSHALRILGSYQQGEKLQLNVLRARKRLSFDITIPEGGWERPIGGFIRSEGMLMPAPGMPAMPSPPSPPGGVTIQRLQYPPANATPIVVTRPDEEA